MRPERATNEEVPALMRVLRKGETTGRAAAEK